jgi:GAF domain-containing protein
MKNVPEIAIPIILNEKVIGVLNVQQNSVGGFDENDVASLRYLVNQVAVAIRNARLFTEIEMALIEAKAAQEKYIEQSWDRIKNPMRANVYLHKSFDAHELDETAITKARELATHQAKLVVDDSCSSIVAPVKLAGKTIGALQLHQSHQVAWTEEDLVIVEAVLDHVAQAAENLRLVEETRERASREQVIREITDKLRLAPNLDALLEIATYELGHRLGVRHTVLELGLEAKRHQP